MIDHTQQKVFRSSNRRLGQPRGSGARRRLNGQSIRQILYDLTSRLTTESKLCNIYSLSRITKRFWIRIIICGNLQKYISRVVYKKVFH